MSELFTILDPGPISLALLTTRLVAALALGIAVAWLYRAVRGEPASSFTTTLVLLAVLIAMVTQVIGDNVARAFSLVGALSIVRFRTVVRDTQDTAYVIFAVAIGMAIGSGHLAIAVIGAAIVAVAAVVTRDRRTGDPPAYRLEVRVGLGRDPHSLLAPVIEPLTHARRVVGVATARQGSATEVAYDVQLRHEHDAHPLVAALNRLDGVQSVSLALAEAPQN